MRVDRPLRPLGPVGLITLPAARVQAYSQGVHKSTYWEHTYEDVLDVIAKLPEIAAIIYRNKVEDHWPTAHAHVI